MTTSRYNTTEELKTDNQIRYLGIPKDVEIPYNSDDFIIRWIDGMKSTDLASKYYNNGEYYWIILKANNVSLDQHLKPGQKIHIPKNIGSILSKV